MKRIKQLIKENRDKLFKVSRNAYMERVALLLERVDLLKAKEVIDDLQVIINSNHIDKVCNIDYNGYIDNSKDSFIEHNGQTWNKNLIAEFYRQTHGITD